MPFPSLPVVAATTTSYQHQATPQQSGVHLVIRFDADARRAMSALFRPLLLLLRYCVIVDCNPIAIADCRRWSDSVDLSRDRDTIANRGPGRGEGRPGGRGVSRAPKPCGAKLRTFEQTRIRGARRAAGSNGAILLHGSAATAMRSSSVAGPARPRWPALRQRRGVEDQGAAEPQPPASPLHWG
eukprot:scaffold5808_cov128-Isochrysis_galbana.AAC.3